MMLKIRLLGTPEISYHGRPLSFRTRKVLALFVYLLVEEGMHSRESLAAMLWPETEAQKAAVTLRGTLSRLRRTLRPAGEVLLTEAGKVGFEFENPIDLDLEWLAAACAQLAAISAPSSAHTPVAADDLAAILDIDRGEFLAGFSLPDAPEFDTWASIERQTCQRYVEMVYDRLTQSYLDMGNSQAAVETAVRWLTRAPLNENAYRQLMTAQALSGDRAAALATFAQCQATLQAELGLTPATKTADLAKRIRDLRLTIDDLRLDSANFNRQSPMVKRQLPLPFVGRADEYSQLVAAFRQIVAGGARAAVVIGAGGVGKTRLVQTFLEWAALDTPDVDIWQGRAFETGGRLPFEPVIESLRLRLEQENAPEDLLEDVWLAELSQLLPELRGRYPDLPLPMTGDVHFVRSRLFGAVATLGNALAARHPAVFVLDDMQWADDDTRDMVHYLLRRWTESDVPILLLLLVRQENFAADASLREWLTRLDRDVPLMRLLLDSLSGTAVRQLVSRLSTSARHDAEAPLSTTATPTIPDASEFAGWLWAETNGLPFFIDALLHMLIEQGVLVMTAGGYDFATALQHVQSVGHLSLPPGVRDVIVTRLERLAVEESVLLLAAAVLGRECSFQRLCQVADMDEMTALRALEALLNGRLLAENGPTRRPYTLAHDHIREVVYNESGKARRRVLHRRALIALEADSAPAAECAFHAVASLLDEPAFRYSLAAGDEALATNALQESLGHYDRARDAARLIGIESTSLVPERLLRLYQNRGRTLELLNQYEAAQANYEEMADLAHQRDDPAMRLAALTSQCIVRATQTPLFNLPEARILAAEALTLARQLGDKAAEAKVLWGMLLVETGGGGNYHQALAHGLRSLELARELDLKEQMGFTYQDLADVYRNLNQLGEAQKANQAALEIWQALGNMPMLVDAYTMQHMNHFLIGELAASLSFAEEALRLSQTIDHKWGQVISLAFMIGALIEIGEPGRASEMISERKRITEAVGSGFHPTYKYFIHQHQISLALSLGVWDTVTQLTVELYENRHDLMPGFLEYMMGDVIKIKVAEGNLDQAQQLWDEISPGWHLDKSSVRTAAPLSTAELYLLLAQNHLQRALKRAQEAAAHFRRIGFFVYLPEVLWLQGRAETGLKQWTQAYETLTEALNISQRNGERRLRWRILFSLAEIAEAQGKPGEAERYRKMGQEIVVTIANNIDNEELRTAFLGTTTV